MSAMPSRLMSSSRPINGEMKAAPAFAIDEGLAIVGYCVSGKHRSNAVMGILLYLLLMSRFHLGSFEVTMLSIHNQELCYGLRPCPECCRCLDPESGKSQLDQDLGTRDLVQASEIFQRAKRDVFEL